MSKVMRSVRNVTKGYSSTQIKVREATSNDPWGPTGTQMSEIAQMTFNTSSDFYDIMDMINKRLNDKGRNWRHVLKALKVLDYCLHEGSELVVTWARKSIYIIKTLREFQYVDDEGRDVGQNVRVAAKELTSLILDEERLRAERSDRKSWKSRVTGVEEYGPSPGEPSSERMAERRAQRERSGMTEEDDAEYRLALEASKYQEEEDRKKRELRSSANEDDDDFAKAIKLSKEEEEHRRRELEQSNAASLFDDTPTQPQPTGFNNGYQQGNQVDWFANQIDQTPIPQQPTAMMNAYTGFQQPQPTAGFQNNMNTGFMAQQPMGQQPTGMNPYGQQQQQPQLTGYNGFAQQNQFQGAQQLGSPVAEGPGMQPGSNNPWATNNSQQALAPTPTGSNNPFAQFNNNSNRPSSSKPTLNSLGSLPEQKTLSTFSPIQAQQSPQLGSMGQPQAQPQQPYNAPQRELNEHEARLNDLLASTDGMDTFGNTGNLRIPAQHTAPGMFVNSAGSGVARINAEATGNNPFFRPQFTGMPAVSYGQAPHATGPGMMGGGPSVNNPFAGQQQQQQQQQHPSQNDNLIQL